MAARAKQVGTGPKWESLWVRATGLFLPRTLPDDAERVRKLRTAVGVAGMVMPVCAALALLLYVRFPGPVGELLGSIYLGSIAAMLVALLLLRTRGLYTLSVNLMLSYFVALHLMSGYLMGGPRSPVVYQTLVIPLCALVVLGPRYSVAWLSVALALYGGLFALDATGHAFPFPLGSAERDVLWLSSTWATLVTIAAIVGNFERARIQALDTLEDANRDLEGARAAADAANRKQTSFLTTMSHEIRTPMTAVLGFTDVAIEQAAQDQVDAEDQRALATIQRNAQMLLKIVDDMLDLASIEAGRLAIRPAQSRLADLLEQVAGLLRNQARARGTELVVEQAAGAPELLHTDPLRVQQILVNLTGNAIRYSAEGEVRLLARALERSGAAWVRFEVSDTGAGLTPAQMAAIFEPFAQAADSAVRQSSGAGLGLSISRVLAELLGGDIHVDSEPGRGSTFCVDLPVEAAHRAEQAPAAPAPEPRAVASEPERQLACRVLFIDDLGDNRRLVGHFLKRAGASVALAESGQDGLRQFRAARDSGAPFDVIITDIQMPDMDGYATRRALQAEGCPVPILALTAHALATERERCLAAGFHDYASKPIDRGTLLDLVARNLERAAAALPEPEQAPAQPPAPAPSRAAQLRSFGDSLVRAITPARLRERAAALRHARTVLLIALVPLPILPTEAWALSSVMIPELASLITALVLLTMPVCLGTLLVYRWSGSLRLSVGSLLSYAIGLVTTVTYFSGGSGAPVACWHVLTPMAAMATLGLRAGVLWTLITLGVNLAFWTAGNRGVSPADMSLPTMREFAATASNMGLAVVATAIGLIHERAKSDAVETLAAANRWLEDARQSAERAGRAKSHFLANISHELRVPLTAILGFGALLADRWRGRSEDSGLLESLRTVQRSGSHLLEVINDLLDLAKIESGSLYIESLDFDPAQSIAAALEPLRRSAAEKGLLLQAALATPLPARIGGDPTRLSQVLAKLCANAVKFTERGGVRVTASQLWRGADPWLRIVVDDTGCGIAAEHLPHLFTPFHQVDDSVARRHGGSGLGLALCRRLVDLMGGTLEVSSTVGSGSSFAFELPLRPAAGGASVQRLPELESAAGRARSLQGARVLLAEDGADNRRLIARILRDGGAQVDVAQSGQRALDGARAALELGEPHDLIVLDLELPDGPAAAQSLRAAGISAPILALTVHSRAEQRERCLAAGFTDLASKPIDWHSFLEQVAALASKR